ncbi:MAG: hypothetical protein IH892_12465 [Planctomycetes bacterium]|nr:hypothetical protein [Planctomycetota bacterium]
MSKEQIKRITLSVSPDVAEYLQNERRSIIAQIEQNADKRITIHAIPDYTGGKHDLVCYNERNSVVKV